MISFAARRRRNMAWLGAAVAAIAAAYGAYRLTLHRAELLTGWLLFALVLVLALYNLRKRIAIYPLGAASAWLQLHVYLGLLAVAAFVAHTGAVWPHGILERLLVVSFVLVAATGVLGLYWSRRLPNRLTRRGEEVIFERIPGFIARLRREAEEAVEMAAREAGSATLADHYREHLARYFAAPRNILAHLHGAGGPNYALLNQLDALKRHLDEKERVQHEKLRALVEKKEELDFHYALQLALKAWLFVHVPLGGMLLMLIAVHLVSALAFSGGL
ncbi:MAG: hypothetical protein ABIR73_10935 [Usitatibacter sp.]